MIDKRCDAGPQVLSVADVFCSGPTFAGRHWPCAGGHIVIAAFAMLLNRFDCPKLRYRCRTRLSVRRWLPLLLTMAVIGGNLFVLHVAGDEDDDIVLPPPTDNTDISCEDGEPADQSLANPCCRGEGCAKAAAEATDPKGAPEPTAQSQAQSSLEMVIAADACWQQQAEQAGVSIGDVDYELEVRDFRVPGLMGAYDHSVGVIYIDLDEIDTQSSAMTANYYDLLVELVMHERLHAEREHSKPTVNIEKETWYATAKRYKAIFDKEPPLVSGSGTSGEANPDYRKHNHGIPACE